MFALVEAAVSTYLAICATCACALLGKSARCSSRWCRAVFPRIRVAREASDRFTVLEFKTGRERSEHRAQIDLYQRAMQQVFPDCKVDARLIYAGAP